MKKHPFHLEIPFSANNLFSWLPSASRQRSARSPLPLCTNKELSVERARAAAGGEETLCTPPPRLKAPHPAPSGLPPSTQIPGTPRLATGLLHTAGGIPRAGSSLHTHSQFPSEQQGCRCHLRSPRGSRQSALIYPGTHSQMLPASARLPLTLSQRHTSIEEQPSPLHAIIFFLTSECVIISPVASPRTFFSPGVSSLCTLQRTSPFLPSLLPAPLAHPCSVLVFPLSPFPTRSLLAISQELGAL